MAFNSKGVGMIPSTTGAGGILTYASAEDNRAAISADSYWAAVLKALANGSGTVAEQDTALDFLRARSAMEDFITQQAANPTTDAEGLPILITGTDGSEWRRATVHAVGANVGRVKIQANASGEPF